MVMTKKNAGVLKISRLYVLSIGILLVIFSLADSFFSAKAHSGLEKSEPSHKAVLEQPPREIRAWFEQELDAGASQMILIDSSTHPMKGVTGGVDLNDPEHKSMVMIVPGSLAADDYIVKWKAVSAEDGDRIEGQFTFTVLGGTGQLVPSHQEVARLTGWILNAVIVGLIFFYLGISLQKRMRMGQ